MDLIEQTVAGETLYAGAIVTLQKDAILLPNGAPATREVVRHPGGVAILPLHADGTVTLVRQYRYPFARVITELPAGKLDPGEDHLPAAIRELREEVGITAGKLTYLGFMYASPGFCDEVLYMYLAQDLTQGDCHPDEDEFLELLRLPMETVLAQIMDGTIADGKTCLCVLKALHYLKETSE
ncbi:MAG: NUDIX hydrolase [Oscillospiraceae bacterium]